MHGTIEQGEDIAFLDLLALTHHHNAVGDFRDDTHVVGDEQQGHAKLLLQVAHQAQHLRLHGDVEGSGRFIRDQQTGTARQRHRDHDPLAHTARHLEWIAIELTSGLRDAHAFQHPARFLARGLPVHALMQLYGLGDLVTDAQHRIERGHRLLKHHRDLGAAQMAHRFRRLACQVANGTRAVAKTDAAGVDPAAGMVDQPGDRQRGDGFARAGLPHDRDGFSIGYRDIEPLDSSDGSAIRRKTDGKADNVEEWNSRGTGRHRMAA